MDVRGLVCLPLSVVLVSSGIAGVVEGRESDTPKQFYVQYSQDLNTAHEYAVTLAREQKFDASLTILQQLHAGQPDNAAVLNDYIVVLNWAGKNKDAIELYEKAGAQCPDFVKKSMAGAYYQTGEYTTAQALYHQMGSGGDYNAKIGEAQSLMRIGNKQAAKEIYDELLRQNNKNIEVYISRGAMQILAGDYPAAIADFNQALQLVPAGDAGSEATRRIHRDMAAAYIRNNDESKAIILLKPYINNGTADVFMQSDYILALRLNRDYKAAINEARSWKDYDKIPVYGLQALGDAYLRTNQTPKAIAIYKHILKREPDNGAVKLGLAFGQVVNGDVTRGIKAYDQVITEDPALTTIALDDAFYFMETGRYKAGKELYTLVINKNPDNPLYRQDFAGALENNSMPREAYDQYKALAKTEGGEVAGTAGMVSTAVSAGDYGRAKSLVKNLHEKHQRDSLSMQAIKDYERRKMGNLDAGYNLTQDHKGIQSAGWHVTASQNIGNSVSVLTEVSGVSLKDKGVAPTEKTVLNHQGIGVQYKGMRHDAQAWFDNYRNNGSFSGYRLYTDHYISDQFVLGLDTWKGPLKDVQALNPALAGLTDGRIMSTNYRVRADIQDGKNDIYSLSYTRSLYSDKNKVNTYEANWSRTLKYNDKVNTYWYTFFKRSDWKMQRPELYESPSVREAFGTGVTKRWIMKKGDIPIGLQGMTGLQQTMPREYLEGSAVMEWGRDRPEPIDFTPHFRLEYGRALSANHSLVFGTEYGLRTDRLNNNNDLKFNYRQYDVMYRIVW